MGLVIGHCVSVHGATPKRGSRPKPAPAACLLAGAAQRLETIEPGRANR
jgi:hypothetical protein